MNLPEDAGTRSLFSEFTETEQRFYQYWAELLGTRPPERLFRPSLDRDLGDEVEQRSPRAGDMGRLSEAPNSDLHGEGLPVAPQAGREAHQEEGAHRSLHGEKEEHPSAPPTGDPPTGPVPLHRSVLDSSFGRPYKRRLLHAGGDTGGHEEEEGLFCRETDALTDSEEDPEDSLTWYISYACDANGVPRSFTRTRRLL